MAAAVLNDADTQLRLVITNLYMLIAQAHDYQGLNTKQAMTDEITDLIRNLVKLTKIARRLPTRLPIEIINYVEDSRNPDIYTREFVEVVMRYNQQQKGRSVALADFRDILAREMASGMPELKDNVGKIIGATGGHLQE